MVLIAALAVLCFFVLNPPAFGGGFGLGQAAHQGAQSTPKEQWTKGAVPLLYQTDQTWASKPYAGTTVEEAGCGPTCLNMVYIALTGNTDHNPGTMAARAQVTGYGTEEGTSWSYFTEGAAELGLVGTELANDRTLIEESLRGGKPIICSMGPGDFTTVGHFIVLVGIENDGTLIVHDPNSPERSAQRWNIDTVIAQCRNLWGFSAA